MRQRSFAGPIILIGLGLIFLVSNLRPELSLWRLLGDYWPFLLILFGVIRLAEVLFLAGRGKLQNGAIRPMGFGPIILVVLIGMLLTLPGHWGPRWHWGPIRAGSVEIFGQEFSYPVSLNLDSVGTKRLVLDNLRGNITVTGGDEKTVHIEGNKIIHAFDQGAADTANGQTKITLTQEGDVIFVRSTERAAPDQSRLSTDLEITLPRNMDVEARGRSGDLSVNSINGSVDVSSQKGEIRLSDVGGNAKLDVEHCDLVRATKVKGTMDVQGNGRDIQLDDVGGQVTLSGRFSGTLDFRNLSQPLHFESEQTDLRVEKLPGSINMDLSDLRASNLSGQFKLVTHSRDVHLEDFAGPVDIELGSGDVDLRPARGQLARMDIRSRHGNIDAALPADGAFDLKATTQQGEVTNDYGDGISSENQGRAASLRSANPKGPVISFTTDRGEISVRKLE